jgi:hypothetical protein
LNSFRIEFCLVSEEIFDLKLFAKLL